MNTFEQSVMNIIAAFEVEIQKQEAAKRLGDKDANPEILADYASDLANICEAQKCHCCGTYTPASLLDGELQCKSCSSRERWGYDRGAEANAYVVDAMNKLLGF